MVLFWAFVRHMLTAAGGFFVAYGFADATMVETGIGAVMTLIGLGMSAYDKYKLKEK